MKYVKINNACFHYYPKLSVFNNLNLDINQGEIVTIMGKSGCGKTTLMHLINNIIQPITGSIDVNRDILCATIFQDHRLIPWMTIANNIAFGARSMHIDISNDDIDYMISLMGLNTSIRNAYPKILSGGMKQRIALARALICKPDLLLMDEPFSALCINTKEDLMQRILQYLYNTGGSGMLITHNLEEACIMSSTIYQMSGIPAHLSLLYKFNEHPYKREMITRVIDNIKNIISKKNIPSFSQTINTKGLEVDNFIQFMSSKGWRIQHHNQDNQVYVNKSDKDNKNAYPADIIIINKEQFNKEMINNTLTRFIIIDASYEIKGTMQDLLQWWQWESIYSDLLDSIPKDNIKIENVLIGYNWTMVQTKKGDSGIARSPQRGTEGARSMQDARSLHHKTRYELAQYITSDDDLARSIGIAAINSYCNNQNIGIDDVSRWGFKQFSELKGLKVCIGRFPPAKKILPDIKIIELEPKEDEYSVEEGEVLIKKADHLIITAQALMNGTLPRILFLGQKANIMLLGPTAPLSPIWKKFGINIVCGAVITNNDNARNFISQGGTMIFLDDQAKKMTIEY